MTALTAKQEAFCLAYLETRNASEAYRTAYKAKAMKPETVHREAKALIDHPKVATRLAELQAQVLERHALTVDDLVAELDENRGVALKALVPQSAAATAATLGKAKLLGFLKDKVEVEHTFVGMAARIRGRAAAAPGEKE